LTNQGVPAYGELDLRLAWEPIPRLEFSVVGQNLLHDHHAEFRALNARQEIERSVYGKVSWSF
jgi:iron complex outermembrane receptor protein